MTEWHENKWRDKSALVCAETREALLLVLEHLNSGQRQKLKKSAAVMALFERYGVDMDA